MIYVCNELEQWTQERFAEQLVRVPQVRRQHILRQTQPQSRYRSLTGWLLLLYAYEQEYGGPLPEIQVEAHGKPSFQGEGWGCFSISHSGNMACCALGEAECGVDIQEARKVTSGLIAKCCNTKEIQLLQNAGGEAEQEKLFAMLWSRKEAMGKQNGLGISQNLRLLGWCEDFSNQELTGFSAMIAPDTALSLCYQGAQSSAQEKLVTVSLSSLFCKKSF